MRQHHRDSNQQQDSKVFKEYRLPIIHCWGRGIYGEVRRSPRGLHINPMHRTSDRFFCRPAKPGVWLRDWKARSGQLRWESYGWLLVSQGEIGRKTLASGICYSVEPVVLTVEKNTLQWYGHLMSMSPTRAAKRTILNVNHQERER